MIASLASSTQAARQAFNFMKPNGMNSLDKIICFFLIKSASTIFIKV